MMASFIPLTQLSEPSNAHAASTAPKKMTCMFCQLEFRTDREYERHLEQLHPGWAMMLLQKIGMNIARENG
jgi:hypothetical protein